MKKMKKIGFRTGSDEENNSSGSKEDDLGEVLFGASPKTLKPFIESLFKPEGNEHERDFKTTAEIEYMLQDTLSVTRRTINTVMQEMGFKIRFIESVPCWEVYELDSDF